MALGHDEADATRVTVTVTRRSSEIAYILAGANSGTYGFIDRLSWNSALERATLALASAALAGIAATRRRKPTTPTC